MSKFNKKVYEEIQINNSPKINNDKKSDLENLVSDFIKKYNEINKAVEFSDDKIEEFLDSWFISDDKIERIIDLWFSIEKEVRQNIDFLCLLLKSKFHDYWLFRYLSDDASLDEGYKFFSKVKNVEKLYQQVQPIFLNIYSYSPYLYFINEKENQSLKDNTINSLKHDIINGNHIMCENIEALKALISVNAINILSVPKKWRNPKFLYEFLSVNPKALFYLIETNCYGSDEKPLSFEEFLIPKNFGEIKITDKELIKYLINSNEVFEEKRNYSRIACKFIKVADTSILKDKDFILELIEDNSEIYYFLDEENKCDAEVIFTFLINSVGKGLPCYNLDIFENIDEDLQAIIEEYIKSDSRGFVEKNMREYLEFMKTERMKNKPEISVAEIESQTKN